MPKNNPHHIVIDGLIFPGPFSQRAIRSVLEYKPLPEDLIIATFPKCGTTWTLQIVTLLLQDGKFPETFKELHQFTPFLELTGTEAIKTMKKPGALKVHMPFNYTPYSPDAKYIYVIRNPRDTCVSLYYHYILMDFEFSEGTFDEFFEYFVRGETIWGDYFDHLMSWYPHRNDQNVLFLVYEEMKKNPKGTVKRIADFIGSPQKEKVENEEFLNMVLERSSMKFMKENVEKAMNPGPETFFAMVQDPEIPYGVKELFHNFTLTPSFQEFKELADSGVDQKPGGEKKFFRKGAVGDWKTHLSENQLKRLDERFKEKVKGFDLSELLDIWRRNGVGLPEGL